ncbi:MAG: nuclear transport factor 2 family protein [Mucilaginibacter sp.]|uniref:nuclear transport factor 2 family protein n=1 Tax=Mucilaginibacter sp. TaxID=1882438 RepID=UPI0032668F40
MALKLNFKLIAIVSLTLISFNTYAQKTYIQGLDDIIKSENNFAKAAADMNVKKAFLANLDSAGRIFNGSKSYNGIATYSKGPENNNALLEWYPTVAQVAATGDIGFTSGPFTYRAKRADTVIAYGYYFTVWKRDKNGLFKIMLDGGVTHSLNHSPLFKPEIKLQTAVDLKTRRAPSANKSIDFKLTETAFSTLADTDPAKAYQTYLSSKARLLRNNSLVQQDKIADLAAINKEQIKAYLFIQDGSGISAGNDFAYTYGSVNVTLNNSTEKPAGFYIRVWQFINNEWKIIADEVSYEMKTEK